MSKIESHPRRSQHTAEENVRAASEHPAKLTASPNADCPFAGAAHRSDTRIAIFSKGHYEYSLNANDYLVGKSR